MPAKKTAKKGKKTATSTSSSSTTHKAVKSSQKALKKAWNKPDIRDGLSFKDSVLVIVIALITLALGFYLGTVYEGSRMADLMMKVINTAETSKPKCPEVIIK